MYNVINSKYISKLYDIFSTVCAVDNTLFTTILENGFAAIIDICRHFVSHKWNFFLNITTVTIYRSKSIYSSRRHFFSQSSNMKDLSFKGGESLNEIGGHVDIARCQTRIKNVCETATDFLGQRTLSLKQIFSEGFSQKFT